MLTGRPSAPVRRPKRLVDGVLLLDKPVGPSSNRVLQQVKGRFQAQKAGHGGTLDPLASGVLPICFGEATKFSSFLLEGDKTYRMRVQLGTTTTTGDAEGESLAQRPVPPLSVASLEPVLARFRGEIWQTPPRYSALKQAGERLCDRVRRGETVEVTPRKVTLYTLQLLDLGENWFDCTVDCSKGTYLRSLAVDLGEALGCGGFVARLHRVRVAPFTEPPISLTQLDATPSEDLTQLLLPLDSALRHWPIVQVSGLAATHLSRGQPLVATGTGTVRLYDDQRFLGIGEHRDGRLWPKRLVNHSQSPDLPPLSNSAIRENTE